MAVGTIIALILGILAVVLILIAFIIDLVVAQRSSTSTSDRGALRASAVFAIFGLIFVIVGFILLLLTGPKACRSEIIGQFRGIAPNAPQYIPGHYAVAGPAIATTVPLAVY